MRERILAADALTTPLDDLLLDEGTVMAGTPAASLTALEEIGGAEVGIWELTAGTVRDVEADEVFAVLAGDATVSLDDGSSIELTRGVVVRLHAGDRTVWEVRQTLRKLYIS